MGVEIPLGYGQATLVFYATGVSEFVNCTFGFKDDDSVQRTPDYIASVLRVEASKVGGFCEPAIVANQWTFAGVDVNMTRSTGPAMGLSRVTAPGLLAQPTVPVNSAFLVKKGTALGGRRHRGRWYLPPAWIGEDLIGAGGAISITSAYTTLQSRLTAYLAAIAALQFPMYLLHGGPGDFVPPPTLVTSLTLQPLLATQRRRMR